MPLYYVDRFDGIAVIDDMGVELADQDAMRDYVRIVLMEMMNIETCDGEVSRCRATVRDASGQCVLEASLVLTMAQEPRQTRP